MIIERNLYYALALLLCGAARPLIKTDEVEDCSRIHGPK